MFDRITEAVQQAGYLGILLLMFGENVFPPIPSELIMPLAGFTAAEGHLNLGLVLLAGTAGSVLGALLWYYIGRWVGRDRLKRWAARHGRWLTTEPEDVDTVHAWFCRHGGKAVLAGRLIPAVRTLVSVPAGITEMPLPRFLAFTTLGTMIWTGFLAGVGYLLEDQYHKVSDYANPVSNVIVGLLVLYYIYRVVTFRRRPARA